MSGKTFAIPDIHGRFDLLMKAISAISARKTAGEERTVILLGDYVDRGPQSMQVIRWMVTLEQITTPFGTRYLFLKGNHEDIMVKALRNVITKNDWMINGGGTTLASYGVDPNGDDWRRGVPFSDIDMLDSLPLYYEDRHRVYVHARVDNRAPLKDQPSDILLWGLYASDDQGGWRGKHVVHGHHQHKFGPILRADRTNLDCGAFYSGRLAVGVFDDETPGGPVEVLDITED